MKTVVNKFSELPLYENKDHNGAFIKDCVSAQDALDSGIAVSKVMYEKIIPGGQIYPHTHNVGEVIYVLAGEVEFLVNGEWIPYKAGDTVIAPAGIVHGARNRSQVEDSEQVSYFIPMTEGKIDIAMRTDILEHY